MYTMWGGITEIHRNLSEQEIAQLTSWLLRRTPRLNTSVPKLVEPAKEADIRLNEVPRQKITKMGAREHVDRFFDDGTLRLGTVRDFARQEHNEIGDGQEDAPIVIIGERIGYTAAGSFEGGHEHYVFCTFLGEPSVEILEAFEYDSYYEITDPAGFSNAVGNAIGSRHADFGRCVYAPYRALQGLVADSFTMRRIDHRTMEMVGEGRNYVKSLPYVHQKELRFTWRMKMEVGAPRLVKCPEAIQFAKRID
ncbi:hypothetical protein SAMN04488026_10882 [Aliiruegeria lutimaris]|uniref:Uncharacterized protein n=1 Tax=Aliiruegeria lutimaris TaxID=571298 RepID=A0A1G9KF84_9RHOB|nr:hypothetical protein SAMN04488026_10882 [Aliiruegeria lutimaris]